MFQRLASTLIRALQQQATRRPGIPSYRQVLHGGFGEASGGSYVLEMDTYPFREQDITVRVSPSEILIEGKMEEKVGDDFMMYVFTKKCTPPTEVDVTSLEYKFRGDTLVLSARTNK